MKFSEKIKKLRLKSGLSQIELADAVCGSRYSIANFENGTELPDETVYIRLANFFGVSVEYLKNDKRILKK